jgi:hypothetical protein
MIKDWRNVWDHQKMPFYFVQLPNLHGGKDWPILRESQEIVYEELTNVEMATTIDIGESRKLHPQNKREVGKRLANLALGCEYRIPAHHKYPELKSVKKTGNTIIINIKNADGLKTTNGKLPANFKLADENGKFKPAKAKVVDSTIKVQSSDIAEPLYVRYAWGADPNVNVVNKYSLPLRPFRTDNFHVRNSDFLPKQLNSKAQLQQNFKPLEIAENQSNEWEYTGESFNEDIKPPVLKSYENGSVRLLTKENKSSPAIVWEKKINTPKNGLTFEIEARIWRANKPYQGLLLETGILKKDKVKVYRLEIKPLLIFAHQQKYISTLAHNINNTGKKASYRIAIRKDGIAQVYYKNQLVGLFEGYTNNTNTQKSYVKFGISSGNSDTTVNLFKISVDETGAYAPLY